MKTGYKEYSDAYLMTFTKARLIKQLRCAEDNFRRTEWMLNRQAENIKDWGPIVHAHWIKRERYVCDSDLKPIIKTGEIYICSRCKLEEEREYPYCHCGAKMDEEENK